MSSSLTCCASFTLSPCVRGTYLAYAACGSWSNFILREGAKLLLFLTLISDFLLSPSMLSGLSLECSPYLGLLDLLPFGFLATFANLSMICCLVS